MKATGWLVACVLGALLVLSHLRGDAERQRLTMRADSLDVAVEALRVAADSQRTADSVEALLRGRVIQGLRANLTQAAAANDSLLGILIPDSGTNTPADSLVGILRQQNVALRIGLVTERTAAQALLAQQDSLIVWQSGRIRYWRDTVVQAKDSQLRVAQGLLRDALARTRPRHGWRTDALLLAGGVVVGMAIH